MKRGPGASRTVQHSPAPKENPVSKACEFDVPKPFELLNIVALFVSLVVDFMRKCEGLAPSAASGRQQFFFDGFIMIVLDFHSY